MASVPDSIRAVHQQMRAGAQPFSPACSEQVQRISLSLAKQALQRANGNASHNTYLWRDPAFTIAEAARDSLIYPDPTPDAIPNHPQPVGMPPLCGIPVSVKDCFDLAGSPTSCGAVFYRDLSGIATHDSWLVRQLRATGAVITGKTHLHPLAYGITGENPDFGDCVQPGDPTSLTGGSSSGAAASILEGSAIAAIGTDTGGSIRVPAALCGIAGYRASIGRGDWTGAAHLAPSFDTMGWLFRNLEDSPILGSIFGSISTRLNPLKNFAFVHDAFLHDCEPTVLASFRQCIHELESLGLTAHTADVDWWSDSREIFAPIQASEAAAIHAGHFAHIEPSIRQRLEWGASLPASELAALRQRHAAFRLRMDALLAEHQLLLLPAAPVARLAAGADHTQTRARLLRYTTPASLAGFPAITIPFLVDGRPAGGMQLIAAHEDDARLLAIGAALARQRKLSV